MDVPVNRGTTFSYGTPELLFREPAYEVHQYHSVWGMSPDGRRFIMVRNEGTERSELVLVLNWVRELTERR